MNEEIDLTDLLLTTDSQGYLMPSYLLTRYSDAAIAAGYCEVYDIEDLGMKWIRLTDAGREARTKLLGEGKK